MLSKVSIETADKAGVEVDEDSAEGGTGKEHQKHRHSRRGSRKRKKNGSETAHEDSSEVKTSGHAGRTGSAAATEVPLASDEEEIADEEHEEGGPRGAKSGFRAIPTWEDAVGVIVAKNMESRPRRQGGGPSRSRSSADSHKRQRK